MKSGVGRVWTTLASAIEDAAATLLESRGYAVVELPKVRESGSWNFFGSSKTGASALGGRVDLHGTWLTPTEAREQAATLLAAALCAEGVH